MGKNDLDRKWKSLSAVTKNEQEIQSCFGLVFQNFNLFPHYTYEKYYDAPIHVQKEKR